jgi:DNA-binding NtrC family response regulator
MADILIVDDEEDICDFLAQISEELGFKTIFALTGEEALKLIERDGIKVCIVDLKLSTAMSGIDVIKAIRARKPQVVIAAMSGYVDLGLKQEAEQFNVSAYLEKPSDLKPDVFGEKLKGLMGKVGKQSPV